MQHLVEREVGLPGGILSDVHDYNIAAYLLGRGAMIIDYSEGEEAEVSAIVSAAYFGNTRILELLLSHANDADVGASDDALPCAAHFGYLDVVDVLIDHGFDVNAHSCPYLYGGSALIAACRANTSNPAIVRRLLESGADVLFRDSGGDTARRTTDNLERIHTNIWPSPCGGLQERSRNYRATTRLRCEHVISRFDWQYTFNTSCPCSISILFGLPLRRAKPYE